MTWKRTYYGRPEPPVFSNLSRPRTRPTGRCRLHPCTLVVASEPPPRSPVSRRSATTSCCCRGLHRPLLSPLCSPPLPVRLRAVCIRPLRPTSARLLPCRDALNSPSLQLGLTLVVSHPDSKHHCFSRVSGSAAGHIHQILPRPCLFYEPPHTESPSGT